MYVSIEGQGHFFTIYFFQVLYVLCFTRPRYQVSVYWTIGPLVLDWPTKIISIYILVPGPSVNNYSIMAENWQEFTTW